MNSFSTAASRKGRPLLIHVTTTDISLALLLGPQLKAFADAGYEVVGVSAPGSFTAELHSADITHIPVAHLTRSVSPLDDLLAGPELYRLFRRLRPDIVHTHNPKPGIYGRMAARTAGVPVVVNTVHGLYATADDPLTRRTVVYGLERIAASFSDAELVQNPEDVETLVALRVPAQRLHLLGNGVDLDRFSPGPRANEARLGIRAEIGANDDDIVVGAIGRLVWEKGYADLFAAAAVLAHTPNIKFVVAGPSEPGKRDGIDVDALAKAEADGVRFLGYRDDVEDIYAALDIYVLASHREGFPRSAMEAAAMGLPVVATDIRGCRQVVDDGDTGMLVPPRNPQALSRAIAHLATEEGLRRSMAQKARLKASNEFDQRKVIDITLSVYSALLAEKGVNHP